MEYIYSDELVHSDEHYAATEPVTGNELKHWKYIERYKNSHGNWVYVYAKKKTHDEIRKAQDAVKISQALADEVNHIDFEIRNKVNDKQAITTVYKYLRALQVSHPFLEKDYDNLLNKYGSESLSSVMKKMTKPPVQRGKGGKF